MMTLHRAFVLPLLEYFHHLWCPRAIGMIRQMEAIHRCLTFQIRKVLEYNYWERLQRLKLYSLQWMKEIYAVIYTWKILSNHIPTLMFDDSELDEPS